MAPLAIRFELREAFVKTNSCNFELLHMDAHVQLRQLSCCNPMPARLLDTQAKSDAEHCSACARYFVELCYKFQVSVSTVAHG